ncbi:uncharacterized membrane protein YsdA (DUF1294 family) [Anoxybacillus tepidamans]|uniref:Uncharacterized membrane protein YsdA (DUF1294 family) n=1 Tax=Anoxybacteroides tepidamans TaxID=265948 RepID=A0A7W8IRM0_9BACL|nr:DUF1294 domain-containing protein [Anoxybacillus tepidamans]MBB5324532.1 uncharacterized membrane protein YsdA (DUF1294 family) [Anoxybacillus tepidamans]
MIYIVLVNVIGFLAMAVDKYKAKHRKWRIAERTLWLLSLAGGAIGTTAGMFLFRHKTRHRAFRYGLPLVAILDVLIYVIFYQWGRRI